MVSETASPAAGVAPRTRRARVESSVSARDAPHARRHRAGRATGCRERRLASSRGSTRSEGATPRHRRRRAWLLGAQTSGEERVGGRIGSRTRVVHQLCARANERCAARHGRRARLGRHRLDGARSRQYRRRASICRRSATSRRSRVDDVRSRVVPPRATSRASGILGRTIRAQRRSSASRGDDRDEGQLESKLRRDEYRNSPADQRFPRAARAQRSRSPHAVFLSGSTNIHSLRSFPSAPRPFASLTSAHFRRHPPRRRPDGGWIAEVVVGNAAATWRQGQPPPL